VKSIAAFLAGLAIVAGIACVRRHGEAGNAISVSGGSYEAVFSPANGSLLALTQKGKKGSILSSGAYGLWHVRFQDGTELKASDFHAGSEERSFGCEALPDAKAVRLVYRSAEAEVAVTVTGRPDGLDFVGEITPKAKTVLSFALPARLRFDPESLDRFISPMDGNQSVGAAFRPAFFRLQPQDRPSGWQHEAVGPKGYVALFGAPLDQRPDHDPATTLAVTREGREWLGTALADRVDHATAVVNRPPAKGQADLVLADSPNGPYFSASHLGGSGLLWRLGGGVGDAERPMALDLVMAAIEKLAASPNVAQPPAAVGQGTQAGAPVPHKPQARSRLGLIALTNGPEHGGWAGVGVSEWLDRFRAGPLASSRHPAARAGTVQVAVLASPREMIDALKADTFLAILNPYGEWVPVPDGGSMQETVEAVGRYVRSGGHWFEVGGYPFFYAMRPVRYLRYATPYPDGFADFFHLDGRAGSASVYGVQPQRWPPWEGARNPAAIFVPGQLACGGDERGGFCDRPFATYVAAGQTWRSPLVRLTVGPRTAADGLRAYCQANEIRRRLEDKMPPATLDAFRRAVLVYYAGTVQEKIAGLDRLPVPTLIHFADYLKGGFDKEYPDHLPPNPQAGTPEEFKAFIDRCHELGHLVMPYTNPTWWCDHPRGPTFEREGDAPLLRTLSGQLSYERYSANDGYTVCHWHPAVQAANRKTVRQFTEDYPVDVLFQDQCGARGWRYDTNPASPTPYAYSDGLVSMVAEDCQKVPLSTESGWDRVVNHESQLCGMAWGIVPTEGGPSWRRLMKYECPPETWDLFPLAQYIAHDKTAMLYHDLGQFVTNREVLAWALALGFSLSYRVAAPALANDAPREWLRWLDRVQKSVCARYVGRPVEAFEHDRGPAPTADDDGTLRATYGSVRIAANLGPAPRTEAGRVLAPFGFRAEAPPADGRPGVVAANLGRLGGLDFGREGVSFVVEGDARKADAWVYAAPEQEVCVELPAGMPSRVVLTFDDGRTEKMAAAGGVLRFRLPVRAGGKPRLVPPADLAGKAPRDWPAQKPAIGILDLPGIPLGWTRIAPAEWLQAFSSSRLARELGVPIRRITTVEELVAALKAGRVPGAGDGRAWLALVNPCGEAFPAMEPGKWRETLDLIRDYVNHGGSWWETAGYSFYSAFSPRAPGAGDGSGGWHVDRVGPSGMGYLGLPVGGGEIDEPAEPLAATPEGREWLGPGLAAQVDKAMSTVNRGLLRGQEDPGHLTLVAGHRQDFIGGYRLDGWGWLWRIGGFWPNPDVAPAVAVAATEYLYTHPPLPVKAGGIRYLWHVTVVAQ